MIEDILRDLYKADNTWRIALLRYFNPIGAHNSGLIGEDPNGIPNNLLPYVAQVAVGRLKKLRVFGNDYATHDGTGVRDYIHVMDLADGHVAALEYLVSNQAMITVNLGTGIGYSVLDVVEAFAANSSKNIPYEILPRRLGDVAINYADATAAKTLLGWQASRNLDDMCRDTWHWQSSNPNGFANKP
jgi:UDP-glucose 4-epimerase